MEVWPLGKTGIARIFQRGVTFSHTLGTYWSSTVFLVKVTIFRMSSECGAGGGGGEGLTKSDHLIALLCLCDFERKQREEKFSPASYFLGQDFSWVTRNSFGRFYSPSTPFRAFLFGESNRK